MLRVLLYLAVAILIVYVATSVPLGKHTLVGHIRAIWHTEQVQDLKDGVKVLGGTKKGGQLPKGLKFRDVLFSATAREALSAAGANLGDEA